MTETFRPHAFTILELPDLPKIPDHFVQQGLKLIEEGSQTKELNEWLNGADHQPLFVKESDGIPASRKRKLIKDGVEQGLVFLSSYDMGPAWEEWVRENIVPEFYDTSVRVSQSYDPNATEFSPHTDGAKYKLFYLLSSGSKFATTKFYLEKDKPLIRDLQSHRDVHLASDMDSLTLIDEIQIPENTWVMFNGYILHGVSDCIPEKRIHFSINIPAHRVVHSIRFE